MRKNFGAKAYLYPQPVMIIATFDKNGNPNAMNAAWGGICGYDEIIIDLGNHKTTDNILQTKAFTVAVADDRYVTECDYLGLVSGNDVADKLTTVGFTYCKSEFVNAPIINELPITIECELKEFFSSKYIGKIINVSADEKYIGDDGLPSLSLFTPITFDPVHLEYISLGKMVGKAFSDGNIYKGK